VGEIPVDGAQQPNGEKRENHEVDAAEHWWAVGNRRKRRM